MTTTTVLNVLTRLSKSGGIPRVVRTVIEHSADDLEHYVCQLRPVSVEDGGAETLSGLFTLELTGSWTRSPKTVPASVRLARLIRTLDPDVVHVHTGSSLISIPAKVMSRGDPAWLIDFHEPLAVRHSRMTTRAVSWMTKRNSWGVAHSTPVYDQVLATTSLRPDRLRLIPLGIETEVFGEATTARKSWRSSAGFGPDTTIVMTVGRVSKMKGVERLLDTAMGFRDQGGGDLAFLLVGSVTASHELTDEIRSRGLEDLVFPLGFVEDLPSALHAADIYFSPTTYEGFGLAVVEAMAAGLPVVASDVGGLKDVVEHEVTGFLVDVTRPDQFAHRLRELIGSPDLRQRLGANGATRARDRFDVRAMVASYEDVYRSLANHQ